MTKRKDEFILSADLLMDEAQIFLFVKDRRNGERRILGQIYMTQTEWKLFKMSLRDGTLKVVEADDSVPFKK